jgi:putative hemolysin
VQIEQIDEDTYRLDGGFTIGDFNDRFGTDLPDEDYNTVGGFVFGVLGRAPEVGDTIEEAGMQFDVLEVDGSRIEKMSVVFTHHRPEARGGEAYDDLLAADDEVE